MLLKKFSILIFLVILSWFGGLGIYIYDLTHLDYQCTSTVDGIVILTGGRGRIEHGLDLLQKNKAPRLLISGVNKHCNIYQIFDMQMSPLLQQIELGHAALTTVENAYEAFFWAQKYNIYSLYLVTADYHMRRAQLNFIITLPDLQIYPCPVAVTKVSTISIKRFMCLSHEYNKLLVTWLHFQFSKLHYITGIL